MDFYRNNYTHDEGIKSLTRRMKRGITIALETETPPFHDPRCKKLHEMCRAVENNLSKPVSKKKPLVHSQKRLMKPFTFTKPHDFRRNVVDNNKVSSRADMASCVLFVFAKGIIEVCGSPPGVNEQTCSLQLSDSVSLWTYWVWYIVYSISSRNLCS